MNRRYVLLGLGLLPLVAMGACSPSTSHAGGDSGEPQFLFVQGAQRAELADGTLTLYGVAPTTIFFTDRPERQAGHVETEYFIEVMLEDHDPDSFTKDPPNATLSVFDGENVEEIVMTLGPPKVEGDKITIPVTVLEGSTEIEGGPVSLFIDPIGMPLTPISIAGAHRRAVRRRVAYRRL